MGGGDVQRLILHDQFSLSKEYKVIYYIKMNQYNSHEEICKIILVDAEKASDIGQASSPEQCLHKKLLLVPTFKD